MPFPDDRDDKMIKPAQKCFICKNKKWLLNEGGFAELCWDTAVRADWGRCNLGPKHTQLLWVQVGVENVLFGCVPGGFVLLFLLRGLCPSLTELRTEVPTSLYLLALSSWISSITVEALHGAGDLCHDALLGFSGVEQFILIKNLKDSQNQGIATHNKAFFLSKSTCKTKTWGPCPFLQTTNILVAKDAKVCFSPASLNWSEKSPSASQERIWALLLNNSTTENTGPRRWSEATGCCFAQAQPVLADGFVQQ